MISNTLLITGVNEGGILENSFVERIPIILNETEKMCRASDLDAKQTMHMRLLAEELICMLPQLLSYGTGTFWIESDYLKFEFHMKVKPQRVVDFERKKTGQGAMEKNLSKRSMLRRICAAVDNAVNYNKARRADYGRQWSLASYVNELKKTDRRTNEDAWDELEKSIIANLATNVTIDAHDDDVEVVLRKDFY